MVPLGSPLAWDTLHHPLGKTGDNSVPQFLAATLDYFHPVKLTVMVIVATLYFTI